VLGFSSARRTAAIRNISAARPSRRSSQRQGNIGGSGSRQGRLRDGLPNRSSRGEVRDIHVVAHPVFNPSGDLVEYVGTVMDVTEGKRAEEKLRRSEAYLAEAQKLTHTGSWAWDVAERRALHLSEEWYRIYGFDPEEGMLTWERREERIHPDDRTAQRQAIERAISEKSDYEVEYRILLPGGAARHLHSVGHPVFGRVWKFWLQFVGSSTDITERRQAEEALRQAQADLARISRITTMGELTASLAHEVNQPIAAAVTDASTCLRWLNRDHPDLEEAREAASRVVKDATRAAEIISRTRLLFRKVNPQWESGRFERDNSRNGGPHER